MSKHLPLLKEMFPGELMLDVEQIARCLKLSKGHIYNLSSARKLPFKLDESAGRVRVSIVELADYLDRSFLSQSPANDGIVPQAPVKRAPGRPRGSTAQRLASLAKAAFQASLRAEIIALDAHEVLLSLRDRAGAQPSSASAVGAGPVQGPAALSQVVIAAEIGAGLVRLRDAYESTAPSEEDDVTEEEGEGL